MTASSTKRLRSDLMFRRTIRGFDVRVEQADCLAQLPHLGHNSIDCVVTDPPYFLDGFTQRWDKHKLYKRIDRQGVVRTMPRGMKFDAKQGLALQEFMKRVSDQLLFVMKPGAFYLCFTASRLSHRVAVAIEDSGFEIRDIMLWQHSLQPKAMALNHLIDIDKNLSHMPVQQQLLKKQLRHYKTPQPQVTYEAIILAQKPKTGTFIQNWQQWGTGLMYAPNGSLANAFATTGNDARINKTEHLTPKPVALIEQLLNAFSCPNHLILDPFMGSGTTALACLNTQRHCLGYEINQEHFRLVRSLLCDL